MTLLPLSQFAYDTSCPTETLAVFMTAMKVWGPLSISVLAAVLFAPWWIVLVGMVFTITMLWIDPKFYQSTDWSETVSEGVTFKRGG